MKTRPDADCRSDHKLLTATVRMKLKNVQCRKKGWKLDIDNITKEYKNEIKQTGHNKPTRRKFRGNMESLEGHFQGGSRKKPSRKRKRKTDPLGCPKTRCRSWRSGDR